MTKRTNKVRLYIILFFILLFFLFSKNLVNFHISNKDNTKSEQLKLKKDFLINQNDTMFEMINVSNFGGAYEGKNVFMMFCIDQETKEWIYYILITDMEGNIEVKRKLNISTNLTIEWINSTTLMYGEGFNLVLWNIYENKTDVLDFFGHHDYEYNPVNNTFFTFQRQTLIFENETYLFDNIIEYNRAGEIVWFLNTSSFINYTQWCPFHDMGLYSNFKRDLTHSNSLFFDVEDDIIYINVRNVNTFYNINHTTKEVIWGLGEYGNFTLFDKNGKEMQNLFYHAHAVEKIDENTFIIFDNDYHNQTNPENHGSRLIEINVDETTMTANETWSWVSPRNYYATAFGDADLLPNNNRLGTFGGWEANSSISIGTRLVEVNETGQIVWEMDFNLTENYAWKVNRMERFRYTPILNSPENLVIVEDQSISINWTAWYNFRSKQRINGSYTLNLNDSLIQSGIHTFDKFWRSTDLTFDSYNLDILKNLKAGSYNLTLVLSDEAGHKTYDSVYITVLPGNDRGIGYPLFIFFNFLLILGLLSAFTLKRFNKRSKTITIRL